MRNKILFGIVILFALIIGIYPITYLITSITDMSFLNTKSTLNYQFWIIAFNIHIISSGIALLIGWIQFINKIKISIPRVHRLLGYIFFISVLIGSFSGIYLAYYSNYLFSKIGFGILSVLWFTTSYYSFNSIIKKQYQLHHKWALRTYSITFSAVTFRICFILLTKTTNNYEISFTLSSWLCWIINILIIEFVIQNTIIKPNLNTKRQIKKVLYN